MSQVVADRHGYIVLLWDFRYTTTSEDIDTRQTFRKKKGEAMCMHIYIHTYHVHMYIFMYVCMYVCIYIQYVYVYIYIQYVYVYIYIHIYIISHTVYMDILYILLV